jgi:hypothetical protein
MQRLTETKNAFHQTVSPVIGAGGVRGGRKLRHKILESNIEALELWF